jgi:signal transduction histidine kinase
VRSPGGKFTIIAASTLLFCLLLFTGLGWSLLQFSSEQETKTNARTHLSLIQQAYQEHIRSLTNDLGALNEHADVAAFLTQPTASRRSQAQQLLSIYAARHHLSTLAILSPDKSVLVQSGTLNTQAIVLTPEITTLLSQAAQGQNAAIFQAGTVVPHWTLALAHPLQGEQKPIPSTLLAVRPIDDYFAQDLMQRSGANVLLCLGGKIQGIAGIIDKEMASNQQTQLCRPGHLNALNGTESYFTQSAQASTQHRLPDSPELVIVAVEPLTGITLHSWRQITILIAVALSVIAFGTLIYVLTARALLIAPFRRLRAQANTLIATHTGSDRASSKEDDITMLSNSLHVLSESLENESQALIQQMGNLLVMSDAFISTLNLEHLLSEVVSRLGQIMHAKHVSLLLYGREMQAPWAVAQWESPPQHPEQNEDTHLSSLSSSQSSSQSGVVTVYLDPRGDITMAVTTKMAALPGNIRKAPSSGKRNAIRPARLAQVEAPYGPPGPRIPRPALRDLDLILARMVIQRQKIAYGEDITSIYRERQENWARLALNSGYRSVIAVPLLLQDQAIGAFILYGDHGYKVSSRDTFLLSTVTIQTSMAIQNAILFAEVKEKNEALQRANQLKSQFLANVTHELRTPLHSIISYGALILEGFVDGELTAEQEEHIQFMVRRAEDLSHLVDDMLDLSKIEADRIEVKPEPLMLEKSLAEVVNQLKPLATNKGLYLTLEMEEEIPHVIADGHRLRQVVINLVSNAIKFTERGGVTICCTQIHNRDMVSISVKDTGIGISPAALDYIFEAFRQADGSTTRQFGGTGLGLTIARKLIELQGGEVAVESVPGQGSIFSFTLPVAPPL